MELVGRGVVARKKSLPGEGEQHMKGAGVGVSVVGRGSEASSIAGV